MEKEENKENFDLMCYDFMHSIVEIINNSNLPVTVVYFLLKDVFSQVEQEKERILLEGLEKRNEKEDLNKIEIPIEKE